MENVANVMNNLIQKFLIEVEKPCPKCGGTMHAWKEKRGEEPRCAPICMGCGYASVQKREAQETQALYESSVKAKAVNYLKHQSVLTNKSLLNKRLETYAITDAATQKARYIAEKAIERMVKNEPTHVVFSGKTGVGKTHLAMGMLWEITEKSEYKLYTLFIQYAELLEQIKFAMHDKEAQKRIMGELMSEIKGADVLVLDDLGAEVGLLTDQEGVTNFNIRTLTNILDARENKHLIVTSNLTGKQMRAMYGSRVISRLLNHSEGFVVQLNDTTDKRMQKE